MLSQLRHHEEAYAATMQMPRLPSLRMPLPTQQYHDSYYYHHHEQLYYQQPSRHFHHHPYQRPAQSLPSLPSRFASRVSDVSSPLGASSHKCSLAFILSEPTQDAQVLSLERASSDTGMSSDADSLDNDPLDRPHSLKHKRRGVNGSPSGGGSKSKYCIVEGCTSRAKHARKCWRHGGSVKCKVQDCINRAKSRGVCWSHGGGTTCSHTNCGTIAVSHGFCWAHGGGKRCEVGGCSRPAYERTQNLCSTHFKQQKAGAKPTVAAASH